MTATVDALVRGVAPDVAAPAGRRVDTVLVTGPWLAGTTGLVSALRVVMPETAFAEPGELAADDIPAVVVFVVSAAAPLAESDGVLLDLAVERTDAVIGVVTKIDVHRRWREVLETNHETVQRQHDRYQGMPWVGVAAAPQLGEPQLDRLVAELRTQLAKPDLLQRNRLREWESHLEKTLVGYHRAADDNEVGPRRLRRRRADLLRECRRERLRQSIALRTELQQARVALSYSGRSRCAAVLAELQEDAAATTRRRLPAFGPHVGRRIDDVIREMDTGVTEHLAEVAQQLRLPPVPAATVAPAPAVGTPPLRSRRLETRLVVLLGAGFGLGVALTLSRLLADLTPGPAVPIAVLCVLVGLAVTVWVIGTRGLLQDRAVLDRWVGDVLSTARAAVDQLVATRVLTAESVLTTALAAQEEATRRRVVEQIDGIDARLRELALARARAAAARAGALPAIERAQVAVRTALGTDG